MLDFLRLTSDHSGSATCVQQEKLGVLLGMVTQRDGSDEPPGGCPAMMAGHQIAEVECVKLEANEGCNSWLWWWVARLGMLAFDHCGKEL